MMFVVVTEMFVAVTRLILKLRSGKGVIAKIKCHVFVNCILNVAIHLNQTI